MNKWRSNVKRWRNFGGWNSLESFSNLSINLQGIKPWRLSFEATNLGFTVVGVAGSVGIPILLAVTPNSLPSFGFIARCHDWICTRFDNKKTQWIGKHHGTVFLLRDIWERVIRVIHVWTSCNCGCCSTILSIRKCTTSWKIRRKRTSVSFDWRIGFQILVSNRWKVYKDPGSLGARNIASLYYPALYRNYHNPL